MKRNASGPTRGMSLVLVLTWTAALAHAQTAPLVPDWRRALSEPDPRFSQMPLWFWNDDLDDAELKRQMADFRDHGVYAFVIHPRMGLPKSISFLGQRWMHHVRVVVDEAARTGMRVCLYDEWMYSSGSAHGEVVRSNPAFASQGLGVSHQDADGPAEIELPVPADATLIATLIAPHGRRRNEIDLAGSRLIEPPTTRVSVPSGKWRVMGFYGRPTGGRIRGVHFGEDSFEPDAPFSGDLLNPQAMQAYVRLAYEPYVPVLKDHFGKTVVAMFTDEPMPLGRSFHRGLKPWTNGLAEMFAQRRGYSLLPMLPALFFDAGPRTRQVRADFEETVRERLNEAFYAQLSAWCRQHGLALVGHPAGSEDIGLLRHFDIPGQDVIFRRVLPNRPSALEGPESVVGKSTSSVARHDRRRFNADEVFGAYGWELTLDEMKWLTDWLLVRGVNLIMPHAFYYSVRGERRNERPPDVGPNNKWWPEYRTYADYTARLCALMTDHQQVCAVAVLCKPHAVPWRAAKWLFQHQIDFNYLEDSRLRDQATIEGGEIRVADATYKTLIIDGSAYLSASTAPSIERFAESGGRVVRVESADVDMQLLAENRDVIVSPSTPDLRVTHIIKEGVHFYLLVNEGEQAIAGRLTVRCTGNAEWFDAWTGRFRRARTETNPLGRLELPLELARHASLVLCVEPQQLKTSP
jgi:hypothetical protein